MPEILWKSYIDFEIEQDESDRARDLYKRLLSKTQHVKVWMSYAQFELSVAHDDRIEQARHIYEEANKNLRNNPDKEHRLMLLEAWRDFEEENAADEKSIAKVKDLMPKRVKRRRKIESSDGEDGGWEEFFDYIFPEDESAKPNLKLLAMAKMWKKQKAAADDDDDGHAGKKIDDEDVPTTVNEEKQGGDDEEQSTETNNDVAEETVGKNMDADDEEIKNEDSSSSEDENES